MDILQLGFYHLIFLTNTHTIFQFCTQNVLKKQKEPPKTLYYQGFRGFFILFPLLSLSVRLVLNHLQSVNLGITCYIFHSFYVVSAEKCVKSVVNDAFFSVFILYILH